MSSNLEQRLYRLEAAQQVMAQQIASLQSMVAALQQQQYGLGGANGGGGGGGPIYYGCTLSAALAHGSSVTGQTVWNLNAGARVGVTTSGTIYNDGPNGADDVASGAQVILNSNGDGTWEVIGVFC